MMPNNLTVEQLKEAFHYDPGTGLFTRKSGGTRSVGNINCYGYLRIGVGVKKYQAHVLAWLYVHGEMPLRQIDHINGQQLDNRIENLRLATSSQQTANMRIKQTNSSGAKGVMVRKRSRPYDAMVHVDGRQKFLGAFATLDEAAHAYNKAAIEHFGEFAVLNPIGKDKQAIEQHHGIGSDK